jgi:nucleoid-associated protein YgaU
MDKRVALPLLARQKVGIQVKFRWKTLGGLLLVVALGSAVALLFQRRAASPAAAPELSSSGLGSSGRGRIVPLLVSDERALPAFVAASSPSDRALSDGENRVRSLPTIRASALGEAVASPELSSDFPRPRDLVDVEGEATSSIDEQSSLAAETSFAPIAPPTIVAKPALRMPLEHVVVDGDTLPAIAQHYLGDAARAAEIFAQNKGVLQSPDVLPIGAKLLIGGQ